MPPAPGKQQGLCWVLMAWLMSSGGCFPQSPWLVAAAVWGGGSPSSGVYCNQGWVLAGLPCPGHPLVGAMGGGSVGKPALLYLGCIEACGSPPH